MNVKRWLIMIIRYSVVMVISTIAVASVEGIASDVYRWVDESGIVHYGERPPVNQESERLSLHYVKPNDDADEQLEKIDSANKARKEAEEIKRNEREQAQRQARIRQQNCDNARKNIKALSRNASTKYRQEDGSYSRYSGEEHRAQMDKARQAEREFCYSS